MTDLFLTKNATNGAALAVRKRSLLAPLAAALVLAGCMTQPVAPAPHAGVPVPASFTAGGDALPTAPWTVAAPAEAQPRGEWWLGFQDPVLADLVQRAARPTPASSKPPHGWPRRPRCCALPTPGAGCEWAPRRA